MKKRIKIDSSFLSFLIILTGFLYVCNRIYPSSRVMDNIFDFIGIIVIFKGALLRMAARGHKKAHSEQGHGLVKTGLYHYTRNPMYLGSFMLGAGFVLMVWPWWTLPIFAWLFYTRFKKQVVKEEAHLTELFGDEYKRYCKRVPRVFPKWPAILKIKTNKVLVWEELWSTKERRGLISWPLLAIALESFQEKIIFGHVYLGQNIAIIVWAAIIFSLVLWIRYQQD